ncbi:MAG: hypothetical protein JNK82_03405 [Myxococcaceae bacterium]|nr:hypothetical protein [Myxococcaceae bacterium]
MSDADFRMVQSVLAGERVHSAAASGLEHFLLEADTDVVVSGRELELYRRDGGTRDRFGAAAMPAFVSSLMELAGLARVDVPTYLELPQRTARVWILPNPEHVAFIIRRAEGALTQVVVRTGLLPPFTELPRHAAPQVSFPTPRPCPHCGRESNVYDPLGATRSLVCRSCGDAFPASVFGR